MANQNFPDIALIDGIPPKLASNAGGGAKNVTSIGTLEASAPVTAGTVTVARIPVDAKITSIMIANDDLGTAIAYVDVEGNVIPHPLAHERIDGNSLIVIVKAQDIPPNEKIAMAMRKITD